MGANGICVCYVGAFLGRVAQVGFRSVMKMAQMVLVPGVDATAAGEGYWDDGR